MSCTFGCLELAKNELCSLSVFPHRDAYITMDSHEGDLERRSRVHGRVGISEFFCASKFSWMRVFHDYKIFGVLGVPFGL